MTARTTLAALALFTAAGAHAEAITSVTFNGQGNELLTTSRDDQAVVWSCSTADAKTWVGQKLSGKSNSDVVERHTADVLFAAFNNTGDGIVTAGADRQAIVWERSSTGKPFRPTAFLPLLSAPIDVAFSPEHEQRYVMTADESGTVRLWDAKDGRTIVVRHHSGQLRRLAGRAGGSHVLILGTEVRSQKRNLFGIPVMRGAEPTVVDRLTFADWDLTPAQLPDTNNLRAIAEMTASRRLFDPKELKAEEAGKRDFIQMTPLTPDRVFRHWLDVGKAARSGP